MEAWRAGFWPWPAVRIWPMITSETRGASTPARSSAALIAVLPSSWAGNDANAPLNAPTGVRVALTITTSSFMTGSFRAVWGYYDAGSGRRSLIYVIGRPPGLDKAQRRAKPPHGLHASPLA